MKQKTNAHQLSKLNGELFDMFSNKILSPALVINQVFIYKCISNIKTVTLISENILNN